MQRIWVRFQIGSGGCVPRRRRLAALVSALPCQKIPISIYLGWETTTHSLLVLIEKCPHSKPIEALQIRPRRVWPFVFDRHP